MNKIPCAFQNTEVKTLPADGCIFGHFVWILPAAVHSTESRFDSQSEVVDPCFIYCHIFVQKLFFCFVETVANNVLNHWCVVDFDQLWANAASTLNTAFSIKNVHAKWWIHCLLISSVPLISHASSIYDWPKRVCGVFWCFLGQLPNLDNLSIQHHLCWYICI